MLVGKCADRVRPCIRANFVETGMCYNCHIVIERCVLTQLVKCSTLGQRVVSLRLI